MLPMVGTKGYPPTSEAGMQRLKNGPKKLHNMLMHVDIVQLHPDLRLSLTAKMDCVMLQRKAMQAMQADISRSCTSGMNDDYHPGLQTRMEGATLI